MVNNGVLSVNYDSTSSEEESDYSDDDFVQEIDDEDLDDRIQEVSADLGGFLEDVAEVEIIDNESIYVKFFDKKIKFSEDEECEF